MEGLECSFFGFGVKKGESEYFVSVEGGSSLREHDATSLACGNGRRDL